MMGWLKIILRKWLDDFRLFCKGLSLISESFDLDSCRMTDRILLWSVKPDRWLSDEGWIRSSGGVSTNYRTFPYNDVSAADSRFDVVVVFVVYVDWVLSRSEIEEIVQTWSIVEQDVEESGQLLFRQWVISNLLSLKGLSCFFCFA